MKKCKELEKAKEIGAKYYFTGKPCPRGHIEKRLVSTRRCYICSMKDKEAWAKTDNAKNLKSRSDEKYYIKNCKDIKDRIKCYNKNNRGLKRFWNSSRKKHIKMATPIWANVDAIKHFYKNCPVGHVVDHIVPLRGKNVCGLHILENLQYLTENENLKKGNKYN